MGEPCLVWSCEPLYWYGLAMSEENSVSDFPARNFTILSPVYMDWGLLPDLISNLVSDLPRGTRARLFLVDDASPLSGSLSSELPPEAPEVRVAYLARNLGHQRAIAVGLSSLVASNEREPIVVMDADGEDRPEAIVELWLAYLQYSDHVIVAKRGHRKESLRFRFFYSAYRMAFGLLTGQRLDFGNLVLLPPPAVQRLALMNELWNYSPAAIMRSRLPIVRVPIDRGVRYSGESRMNFTALVNHGLAAIAAFINAVFVRPLVVSGVLFGLFSLAAVAVIAIRFWGTWGVPGWATTALGLIRLGLLQLVGLLVVVTFLTLSMRSSSSPPPIQFAQQYITKVEKIK